MQTNVAFSGPTAFQNFEIDIVLHVDHLTVVALAVIEACIALVLLWNRVMGRNEPGPARFQAVVSIFLFGCIGALMSNDLAELFTFWTLAGGTTYLLLAHRWGTDDAARSGRVALALPFLTDLFLLCGIAVLYSAYGKQNLVDLLPLLHMTGWSVRTLVIASVLLFVGVAGRLALWPLQSWINATATTAPPAASAIAQSVWPVIGIMVLYRLLPVFYASNPQAMRDIVIACGVSAVVAPLASLIGREPRQVLALAGSGITAVAAAVVIHGFQYSYFTFATAGVACVFAVAPARAAAMLAASSVTRAMRTRDMAEMGDAWRRMRASAGALLGSAILIGMSATGALVFGVDTRSRFGVVLGEAAFLAAVAALRVFLAVSTGPLLRRRAFEPDRVRDVPPPARPWPYALLVVSAVLVIAAMSSPWLVFFDHKTHHLPQVAAYLIWLAVPVVGLAAVSIAFTRSKENATRAMVLFDEAVNRRIGVAAAFLDRYLFVPLLNIVDRVSRWVPIGDSAVGRVSLLSGRAAATAVMAPALPVLVVMAVLLGLLIALLSPGVLR
jgi:NADH:ubiquinone oxidoreductase subunit 5 (subunit L)/multisubunit Na+/H+ antiporter MnhA subunit